MLASTGRWVPHVSLGRSRKACCCGWQLAAQAASCTHFYSSETAHISRFVAGLPGLINNEIRSVATCQLLQARQSLRSFSKQGLRMHARLPRNRLQTDCCSVSRSQICEMPAMANVSVVLSKCACIEDSCEQVRCRDISTDCMIFVLRRGSLSVIVDGRMTN